MRRFVPSDKSGSFSLDYLVGTGKVLPGFESGDSIRQRHRQRHRIGRRLPKAAVFIKPLRCRRESVHENSADSNNPCRLGGAQNRVAQQQPTEAAAVPRPIDGQAAYHGHRDRVRHVSSHPPRRLRDCDRAGGEAVIPDNAIALTNNIAPRGAARLVRSRPPAQPVIECRFAAGEAGQIVSLGKQYRCSEAGKCR
jgi:hypothetical protein